MPRYGAKRIRGSLRIRVLNAAAGGRIELLKVLSSKYPTLIYERDGGGDTALTLAAERANKKTVKYLIEELSFDPYIYGSSGRNAFHYAAHSAQLETLKYLNSKFPTLKYERDISERSNTVLILAACCADLKTVKFLIVDLELDPYETDRMKKNIYHSAAMGGKIEILKYLNSEFPELKNGSDSYGNTALTLGERHKSK